LQLTYKQAWRVREFVYLLQLGRLVDYYKLLPWLCSIIVRANLNSRVFYELEDVRFKRIFVAHGAASNEFIIGYRKILFIDAAYLSDPYNRALMAAIALDTNSHLFDVTHTVVGTENQEEWFWFITVLAECLGGLKLVIMSD